MRALAVWLLAFCMSAASAGNIPLRLYILPHGHVRFEQGPKINLRQLRQELRKMSQETPPPEVRLTGGVTLAYRDVEAVVKVFQELGYNHLGLAVLTGPDDKDSRPAN